MDGRTGLLSAMHFQGRRTSAWWIHSHQRCKAEFVVPSSILFFLGRVYNCTYVRPEWDPDKARLNARKHGVSFADAVASLEDERALTVRDPSFNEEERWVTMGLDGLGRVLVVVYTWRGESVRLISARKATARERRQYEENNEASI